MLEKIKAWFKHSVTILVARITSAAGLILGILTTAWGDPTVQQAVSTLGNPKVLPWIILGMGLLTEIARRRTL